MKRKAILERNDPLFEHDALPVSLSRFASFRQTITRAGDALLTVRLLSGSSIVEQEPILRVEIVGEDLDPFVLYLTEITLESYAEIKEEQALRVNFEGFALHMVQLLEKCARNEFRLSLSTTASSAEDTSQQVSTVLLNVYETTAFRELSHLSLRLDKADETQTRDYLWERLRQENKQIAGLANSFRKSEEDCAAKVEEMKELQVKVESLKLQMVSERNEFQASLERRHAEALREARLEVSQEEREKKDRTALRILELENRIHQLEEELIKTKDAKAEAEAEVLRRAGASDAIGPLRAEANELRTRCRELESRAFEESSRSARLQEHVAGLERELTLKEESIAKTSELLHSERERLMKYTEETESLKSKLKEMEQRINLVVNQEQTSSLEYEKVMNELEVVKQKLSTKNIVIREQERVVQEHEMEIQRLKASGQDLERELSLERTKNSELRAKIQELKQHLEESARMLETNASVISYLNRELAESVVPNIYTSGAASATTTGAFNYRGGTSKSRS